MGGTKIEWCDRVWNPVTGCSPISPGCDHCYAARMARRLRGRCGYPDDKPFRVTVHPDKLELPLKWQKPQRVFVNSMGDLFHEDVLDEFIAAVFATIFAAHQHIFMILTKRPERMKKWIDRFAVKEDGTPTCNNLWLGVTVENQEQDWRIKYLLDTPAAVRLVSIEPMLGVMDISPYLRIMRQCDGHAAWECNEDCLYRPKLDMVICGGETGPGARLLHPDWVRSLRDQCVAADVPFFFKQWGEWKECDYMGEDFGAPYTDSQCINGELWDLDKCDDEGRLYSSGDNPICPKCKGKGFVRVGKKHTGSIIDGQEWRQFPEVATK
jgi:protein gp37